MEKLLRILLPLLAAVLLGGCATRPDGEVAKKPDDKDQYIYVESVGSRIPRRIRIDQLSTATLRSGSPTAQTSGEGVREMLSHRIPATSGTGGF